MEAVLSILVIMIIALIGVGLLLLPGFIAIKRNHQYRWIILAVGLFGGIATVGLLWLGALVWALWPAGSSLVEPVLGSPTGLGVRNVGDTLGATRAGLNRGYEEERNRHGTLTSHQSAASRMSGASGGS